MQCYTGLKTHRTGLGVVGPPWGVWFVFPSSSAGQCGTFLCIVLTDAAAPLTLPVDVVIPSTKGALAGEDNKHLSFLFDLRISP